MRRHAPAAEVTYLFVASRLAPGGSGELGTLRATGSVLTGIIERALPDGS